MGPFASCFCNIPKGSILVASMKIHWSLLDREQTVQLRNMRCSLIICKLSADLQGFILVFFRNLDFRFFRETFIFFVGVGIKLSLHGYIGNSRGQRLLVHVIKPKNKDRAHRYQNDRMRKPTNVNIGWVCVFSMHISL